jgi:molybdopterin-guanine dinucleotide biosynthesis protein A
LFRGDLPFIYSPTPKLEKGNEIDETLRHTRGGFGILFGILAALTCKQVAAAGDDVVVLQADHAFVQAIAKSDKASLGKLLEADFTWTNSEGKTQTKAEVLQNLPTPASGYKARF